MSVAQLYFVFGQSGSYMLDHPRNCITRNLPTGLVTSIAKHPIQKVKTFALDANGNYACVWKVRQTHQNHFATQGLHGSYPGLQSWLDEHDFWHSKFTFGPHVGEYFVWKENSNSWHTKGTSPKLVDFLKNSKHPRNIKQVALGIHKASFVLFTNGEWKAGIDASYPELRKILDGCRQGDVQSVALNPYRENEFFVALTNGKVHIRASVVCEVDVEKVLSSYPELEIITSEVTNYSHHITAATKLPQKARKPAFLKELAKSTAGGVAAGLATALISMTASCTVM